MHEVKSINFESGMLQPILKQKGEGCVLWQKWASEGWGGGEWIESSLIQISSGKRLTNVYRQNCCYSKTLRETVSHSNALGQEYQTNCTVVLTKKPWVQIPFLS